MKLSIVIVDDHEIVRQGVRSLLAGNRPEWSVVAEASNGLEALEKIPALRPDVVILDVTMPGMSGLQVGAKLQKMGVPSRILFFTMHNSRTLLSEVRDSGGRGYVLKTEAAQSLIRAIEIIHSGGKFFAGAEPGGKPEEEGPDLGFLLWKLALA